MIADHDFVDTVAASPNHDTRAQTAAPSMIVLHYTGMASGEAAMARLRDGEAKVSSHYLVGEDGSLAQLVPESRRAWHAGAGSWFGQPDVNSRSIGIEIVNPGHSFGYRPFPAIQIARVVQLCAACVERWAIAPHCVVAHSDIAPDRKQDPGELFPWDQLWRSGIGLWVEPARRQGGRFLQAGDEGDPVAAYQGLLAASGYGVAIGGKFDDATRLATLAFQRRQRQSLVDGIADRSTIETLHRFSIATSQSVRRG